MTPSMRGPAVQTLVAYGSAIVVLTVYGDRVCPYLESLSWGNIAAVLGLGFAIAAPLRLWLVGRTLQALRGRRPTPADLLLPRRVLLQDLALWCLAGAVLMVFDTAVYGFPVESGMKIVVGCAALGVFGATDLALQIERDLMERLASSPCEVELAADEIVPLSRRFMVFFVAVLLLVVAMLVLVLKKDFSYLEEATPQQIPERFRLVALEVVFLLGVLGLGCLVVARRFAANMNALFAFQLRAMEAVAGGRYDVHVPVASRDELNLVATHTNRMIAGLREKERVKSAFGKYMSPQVAERILASEQGAQLGGRNVNAAVLFTDIRGFTPLSESLSPEALVSVLNEYFTAIVGCVHERGGVLDKFIGDAAMAVFGLDEESTACERAVASAVAMREQLRTFNASLAERGLPTIENGIGIHFGPVLAGNIGSPDRLEYTVIGDTVNIASRLESVTKELGAPLVVSEAVYEHLGDDARAGFTSLGEQALKGKSSAVPVFGRQDRAATDPPTQAAPAAPR